eukprot:m51a1_g12143 putative C-tail anchored protein (118) ;mRNA; f:4396-4908
MGSNTDRRALLGDDTRAAVAEAHELERQNDRGLDTLATKVSAIRSAAVDMQSQVEASRLEVTDLEADMGGARGKVTYASGTLRSYVAQRRNTLVLVAIVVATFVVFLVFYFVFFRRS